MDIRRRRNIILEFKKFFPVVLLFLIIATILFQFPSCSRELLVKDESATIKKYYALYQHPNWRVRKISIKKVSRINSPAATELLLNATQDIHPSVRIEALKGLSVNLPLEALEKIKLLAEYDRDDNTRWYALKTLSKYRDPDSAQVFAIGLKSRDWLIREESVKGLAMIEDYSTKYVCIPLFIKALKDERENVRIAALENLSIKDQRLYRIIVSHLEQNLKKKHTMLCAILKALEGYKPDDKTKKILLQLLIHPNKEIRLLAFKVLNGYKKDEEKN